MGRSHFPPPEYSPRSIRQPKRFAPGIQRVEAKPQNHFNSRPSTPPPASNRNNKPSSRPPTDNHGKSNFRGHGTGNYASDYRRAPRDSSTGRHSSNRSNTIGGIGQDHPVNYDQRDPSLTAERRNPSEIRLRLPEKFYSNGGETFAEVMKKPAPVIPKFEYSRAVAQWEGQLHADQLVGKPFAYTEFQRSTGNAISTPSTALNQILNHFDLPNPSAMAPADELPVVNESILNLNLDEDLNQFDRHSPSVVDRSDEQTFVKESTWKENIWGSGSFVDVLKKPAPITPPTEVLSAAQQFEGRRLPDIGKRGQSAMNSAGNASGISKNTQNQNGYQNKTRYYERNDRATTARGRKMDMVKKPNRKEHHSRGEESVPDAAKKKIRTPEYHVPCTFEQVEYQPIPVGDLPKFAFTETGNSSAFIIGNANTDANGTGGYRNNTDLKGRNPQSFAEVNAPSANTTTFADGILHRRSFVDVVRRGPESQIPAGITSNLLDPSIYNA